MKNYLKTLAFVAVVGMAGVGVVSADVWDKKTIITTGEVMQLPNMMLQPGTYVIRLADSTSNRHIVQFFDKDEKHLITTVLAIPNERLRLSGKSVFAFWEVPAGQPKALRAWFYPGDNFGQEFAYPRQEATKITASNTSSTVPIDDRSASMSAADFDKDRDTDKNKGSGTTVAANEPAPAPAATTAPEPVAAPPAAPAVTEIAAAPQQPAREEVRPAPAPDTTADARRVSESQPPAESLPKTASNLPLAGLIGLLSIVGAFALKVSYR